MATSPNMIQRSGQVLIAAAVARELGVKDIDGTQPRPISVDEA